MSKLFITGGTGFFGKNILKYIFANEEVRSQFSEIIILTRNSNAFLDKYPEFKSDLLTFVEDDVRCFCVQRTDFNYIMHLAADFSSDINENHLEIIDVNFNGTKNVLELASRQVDLKRMIFASSGAVYGEIPELNRGVGENEYYPLNFNSPVNSYALSKQLAEMMCNIFIQNFGLPIVIVRGFAFLGEFLPENSKYAINDFKLQAKKTGKIVVKGDGSAKRSYMDSSEMARFILELLFNKKLKFSVYNLGSENAKTIKEWAEEISQSINNVPIEVLGQSAPEFKIRKYYIPNIDRLKNIKHEGF